jgi:hypothetical protein
MSYELEFARILADAQRSRRIAAQPDRDKSASTGGK